MRRGAPRAGRARLSALGADVSSLHKSEELGGVYFDDRRWHRHADSALEIPKRPGLSHIRLRVWVDPADGYHEIAELVAMARRAKRSGLGVLVDLHYSDTWADLSHPTPQGQARSLRDVLSIVRAVPNGRGLGAFYWDATWTAVPGNGWDPADPTSGDAWENQALFDFDDRVLPAADELRR